MRWLETRIPPPVVLVLLGAAAFGVAQLVPTLSFEVPLRIFAVVVFSFAGLALNLIPKVALRRAGTTVNPLRPDASTRLITSGFYRLTRNPMYLGHAMLLFAWSIHLSNVASLLVVPVFLFYISRFQIRSEERFLLARFQDAYVAFCRQTPRWL